MTVLASCQVEVSNMENMKKAQLYRVEVLMSDGISVEYYLYAINEDYAIKGISKRVANTGKSYSCSPIKVQNEPFMYEIVIK